MEYKVYLADDDSDDRAMFEEALNEPLAVTTFEGGDKMLQNLLHDDTVLPDVIFLDLQMPNMDGAECLDLIKKIKSLAAIPIILYSDFRESEKIDRLLKKGADFYLKKPSRFCALKPALWRSIEAVMEGKEQKK